ncbi:hypothetical protein BH10PSE9_BH10PSE9_00580 [soil metagenome]
MHELEETLAEQSRVLFEWARKIYPGEPGLPTSPHSVENQIRHEFPRLKRPH